MQSPRQFRIGSKNLIMGKKNKNTILSYKKITLPIPA